MKCPQYSLQISSVRSGVVNITLPEQQPRPTLILLRPRPCPNLLNREAEVDTATTALLRYIVHHPATGSPNICPGWREQ